MVLEHGTQYMELKNYISFNCKFATVNFMVSTNYILYSEENTMSYRAMIEKNLFQKKILSIYCVVMYHCALAFCQDSLCSR